MANSVFKIENGLTVVGGNSTFGNSTTGSEFFGPVTIASLIVTGTSQFQGTSTTTGTVSSAADYVPSIDGLVLGSATYRWQGHFVNVISYGTGGFVPSTNTAGQLLGSATRRWELNANTINATGLSTLAGSVISGTTNVSTFNATTANVTGLTGLAGGLIVTGTANASIGFNVGTFGVTNGTAITNTSISVGNSTANALLNYNLISVANLTSTSNLSPGILSIGTTTVNGSFINVGTLLATSIANVTGTLSVTGAANALSTFGVRGNTVFDGNVTIGSTGLFVDALNSRIAIGSLTNLSGTTLYIQGSLQANGAANAMSTFGINGLTTAAGGLVVTGIANVSVKLNAGAANVTGLTGLAGGLDVTGTANVFGGGGVTPTARFATGAFGAAPGISIIPNAGAGTLTSLVAAGDILLNFSSGAIETGNLVIAPWSSTSSGIKINGLIKDIALVGNSFTFTTGNSNFDSGVLFVDALNNRVGIGTTTPDANLAVVGTANISGISRFSNTLTVVGAVNFSNTLGVTGVATFSNDVTIAGNLTVSGTRTYVNTTTLDIGDNIITLNADLPGATAPTENAGIEINRGSSANSRLQWNESSDTWQITSDSINFYNVVNEGTSNTSLDGGTLFIDALNNRVGINNTAPLVELRVTGAADISSTANVGGTLGVAGVLTGSGGLTVTGQTNTTTLYAATSANVGTAFTANSSLVNAIAINVVNQTNTATLNVGGTAVIANATGIYTTGVANAFSHTVGASFIANSILVIAPAINVVGATNTATFNATGLVNAAAINVVGATNTATFNATGLVNAAAINVVGQTNTTTLYAATSANVGTAVIANATGIYTTGVANAFSHTVSTSFIANSSLVTAPAINVVGATNTSVLNVTGLTTLSGNTSLAAYTEKMVSITGSATTIDLDLKVASVFKVSMPAVTANLRFINPPATGAVSATLIIQYTGTSAITLQGNNTLNTIIATPKYAYNSPPTFTQFAGNTDILSAITYDGGASYIVSPAFMKFTT